MPSRRWQLIFVTLVIILSVVSALYYLLPKETASENTTTVSNANSSATERVFVADLHEYVDMETKKSIERTLYENINKDQPDLYTGTVRPRSFLKNILPSGQTKSTLLIDVQPIKVTYEATLFSNPRGGRPSVNIQCASQEQQLTASTICKDTHHHD